MAASTPSSDSESLFLALPVELRLHIYGFVFVNGPEITIAARELVGPRHAIVHELYGDGRSPYRGLPQDYEPVVQPGYDAGLLSAVEPPKRQVSDSDARESVSGLLSGRMDSATAQYNLLLVNHQINHEVKNHFDTSPDSQHQRASSVFVQYPHGLHIFRTSTPHILHQARTIHVAGVYHPTTYSSTHRANLPQNASLSSMAGSVGLKDFTPDSATQLRDLVKRTLSPDATHPIARFEMRMYYPGPDSYSMAWSDDRSPLVIALSAIGGGHVSIEVWRGRHGTGILLSATSDLSDCDPKVVGSNDPPRRVVTTMWKRLVEGGRNEPKEGSWVVDPNWPKWEKKNYSDAQATMVS